MANIKVNIDTKNVATLRNQLRKYLFSIRSSIMNQSYDKFDNIFINSNRPKMLKYYELLQKEVAKKGNNISHAKVVRNMQKKISVYCVWQGPCN